MAKISKTQKKRRAPRASGVLLRKPKGTEVVPGLTGYLVVWRHTMDDLPIGLFKTKTAAIKAAKTTSFRAGYATAKKLDIDCRTPVCFAVIAFDFGKPTKLTIVDRADDA
jgi:hypothetical protein